MNSEVIGVTTCENCSTRIKVKNKHNHLIGKAVRCPKCKTLFTLFLSSPTNTEKVSIENEEEKVSKKKRKTKAEIKQEIIKTVKSSFKGMHARLVSIVEATKSSEEEVRRWVIDVIKEGLGYKDNEIDTEVKVLGKRVDIVLKKDGKVFLVIECKNTRFQLRDQVRDQAANYATGLSADWIITTNAQIWKLYRVIPVQGKNPKFIEIFDVALLDEDGVSDSDVENLYLITPKAIFGGDLEKMYKMIAATSKRRILKAIESERVFKAIKTELTNSYKEATNDHVTIDNDHMKKMINETFGLLEL